MKLKILQSNLYVKDTQWNLKRMSACLIFLRECHMHYHSSLARYLCLVVRGGCNGKTSGHVIYLLAGAPEFTLCYLWVRVTQSLVFCVVFCGSLFVLLSFPLGGGGIALSVLRLTLLITMCTFKLLILISSRNVKCNFVLS